MWFSYSGSVAARKRSVRGEGLAVLLARHGPEDQPQVHQVVARERQRRCRRARRSISRRRSPAPACGRGCWSAHGKRHEMLMRLGVGGAPVARLDLAEGDEWLAYAPRGSSSMHVARRRAAPPAARCASSACAHRRPAVQDAGGAHSRTSRHGAAARRSVSGSGGGCSGAPRCSYQMRHQHQHRLAQRFRHVAGRAPKPASRRPRCRWRAPRPLPRSGAAQQQAWRPRGEVGQVMRRIDLRRGLVVLPRRQLSIDSSGASGSAIMPSAGQSSRNCVQRLARSASARCGPRPCGAPRRSAC